MAITTDGEAFKIDDRAEVTVMLYHGKTVKFNYALTAGSLNEQTVAEIEAMIDGEDAAARSAAR